MSTGTDTSLKDVIDQQTNQGLIGWLVSRHVFWIFIATVAAFTCVKSVIAASAGESRVTGLEGHSRACAIIVPGGMRLVGSGE